MPVASVMAEPEQTDDPGAPIAKDAVDPELIKLSRARPKIGIVTAAGLVFLSIYVLARINPDRRFSAYGTKPATAHVSDVLDGKLGDDAYVAVDDAVPLMSHAIRATTAKGSLGFRVAPVRGTGDQLWLVLSGDGWEPPADHGYVGRLRKLRDLPFAAVVRESAATHPRPVFAPASAVRDGFPTDKVATITGESVTPQPTDRIAFEVTDPNAAVIVCTLSPRLPSAQAWVSALAAAGVSAGAPAGVTEEQARFDVAEPNAIATLTTRLEHASLWGARVDPVTRHYETTWGALRGSSPAGFVVDHATIADAQIELVGLYVAHRVPAGAYVLVTGEQPDDYWYVMPITIALAAILLVFAWALVRAIRRDLVPARAA